MKTPAWLSTLEQRVAQRADRSSIVLYTLAIGPILASLWLLQWAPVLHRRRPAPSATVPGPCCRALTGC